MPYVIRYTAEGQLHESMPFTEHETADRIAKQIEWDPLVTSIKIVETDPEAAPRWLYMPQESWVPIRPVDGSPL